MTNQTYTLLEQYNSLSSAEMDVFLQQILELASKKSPANIVINETTPKTKFSSDLN